MKGLIKNSIRNRLAWAFVALALGPLLPLGGIFIWQSYFIQREQALELQKGVAERAADQVYNHIHSIENDLDLTAEINDIMDLDRDRQKMLLSKMLERKDLFHGNALSKLVLVNSEGKELARALNLAASGQESIFPIISGSAEFMTPITEGRTYYGPVLFENGTDEPFISLGIPIKRKQQRGLAIGVLLAEIRLTDVWNHVSGIGSGEDCTTYITDSSGRIIGHKDFSLVEKGAYLKAPESPGIYTGLDGKKVVILGEKVELGDQTLYVVTERSLYKALSLTIRMAIIAAVLLIMAIAGVIWLGLVVRRQIIRPLELLADTAGSISRGDLSRKAEPSGSYELDAVADAFNKMSGRLIETITSLRLHMEERDAVNEDLLEKSVELRAVNMNLKNEIRERARMEEALLNAKKLESVGILAAGVAHEINNPMTNAFLNLQILKRKCLEYQKDEEISRKFEALEKNLEKASRITKELLQFSSPRETRMESVDINEVLESSLMLVEHRLGNISVHRDLGNLPSVTGDFVRLEQVFINVLNNSVDAMPKGGSLLMASRAGNGCVEIKIADTGTGISNSDISKIFDPFFTTKDVDAGTGLGLSICYGIIKQHGGTIEATSSPGNGTAVVVKLPADTEYEI